MILRLFFLLSLILTNVSKGNHTPGGILQFQQLNDSVCAKHFFSELYKIRKEQYPKGDIDTLLSPDILPSHLDTFLSEFAKKVTKNDSTFSLKLDLGISPSEFKDTTFCKDKIVLHYYQHKNMFRLEIHNSFLVEYDMHCTEGMVVYWFQIKNHAILRFGRDEAG